jgi:hypothetical protein
MGAQLVLQFTGWCLMRIPTDPDPTDEPRGASGYTFAFAGEPDLDRFIYLQPPSPKAVPPRLFAPEVGVTVGSARRYDPNGTSTDVPALVGAQVNLLDNPVLENRNWTLTLPGFEPIVPFRLQVASKGIRIHRDAPIDPDHPNLPVWKIPLAKIVAQGAAGMAWEPGTVGRATGIWDALAFVTRRRDAVKKKLEELEKDHGDPVLIVNLRGRLAELDFAVKNPGDRRVLAKSFVERFSFPMLGKHAALDGSDADFGGKLDPNAPWSVAFWIGAWDPDALCAFMEGSLSIPYAAAAAATTGSTP